jgi:hypothetical protein
MEFSMNLKHVAMVQQPRSRLWPLLRDFLPDLAGALEDLDAVVTKTREAHDGEITVVSVWRTRSGLASLIKGASGAIEWTDRSLWRDDCFETRWEVTPHLLGGRLRCVGTTRYAEAMGRRGTRASLEVAAEVLPDPLTGNVLETDSVVVEAMKTIAATLICKNFRRLLELADQRLRASAGPAH